MIDLGRRAGSWAHAAGVAAALCLLFVARVARADALVYEAMAGCPAREAFVASVVARTPLAHLGDGGPGRSFRVVLGAARSRDDGPYLGTLAVTGDGGVPTTREIDGATCDEVADAMSLVVALAIDPNAKTEVAPAPGSPPLPLTPPRENKPPVPPRTAPPSVPASRPFDARLALEGLSGAGVAPSTTVGAGVDLGLARRPTDAGLAWAVAGHVRASFEKTVFAAAPPSADTVRAIGVLSLCPVRAGGGPLVAELCAGVGAGVVRFEGEGAANPSAKMRFWSHVEASLVTTVALGRSWFVGARPSLEVPLTRDELVFVRPEIFVHRAAAVTGNLGAFVGLRL